MTDLQHREQTLGTRPALVLVDLSVGFTDPASPLGCACDAAVAENARLLSAFRQRGLPIFFTTVCYRDTNAASVFRERLPDLNILIPDSRWVAIDPRVAPTNTEPVIEKHHASGFFETSLADDLSSAGVDCVVVTGLTTSGCVRATAVDALQHNYRTFVISDAVADRNAEAHSANLHDLDAKYAQVLNGNALVAMLPAGAMA
jgi:nicotinamidase-related amidase